jgi:hypothetical protein
MGDLRPLYWRGIDLTQHDPTCDGCRAQVLHVPICLKTYAKAKVKGMPPIPPDVAEKIARLLRASV